MELWIKLLLVYISCSYIFMTLFIMYQFTNKTKSDIKDTLLFNTLGLGLAPIIIPISIIIIIKNYIIDR